MSYPALRLHVMSGTGNTLRVARWLEAAAQERGATTEVRQVRRKADPGPAGDPAGLTGLLFPTHGFTAPWAVIPYLIRFPRGQGRHAFVLATAAGTRIRGCNLPGLEGTATLIAALLLRLRGYRIRGLWAVDMPSNWTFFHWGLRPENSAAIIEAARSRALDFFARLDQGGTRYGRYWAWALGLLLVQVSLAYLLVGRFLLAKAFFAGAGCDDCGLCVSRCPHGGVVWAGRSGLRLKAEATTARRVKPYWTYACESCMRCMAYCPRKAVEPSWSWFVLLVIPVALPLGYQALAALFPGWSGLTRLTEGWGAFLVNYPYKLAAGLAAYWVFWQVIRWRPLRRLFTAATPTHYWRRYHEPETRISDLEPGQRD
jgi:NAD-dependent dihydropyrimidine dehydrogenase PreA subunit